MRNWKSGGRFRRIAALSDCDECLAASGIYFMSCIGCLKRLIEGEPSHKRKAVAAYALQFAPDGVAAELRLMLPGMKL